MAQTDIPQKTKIIMTIAALFMPVFLILPFFFWGGSDDNITIDKELQASRLAPVGQLTIAAPAPPAAEIPAAETPAADTSATASTEGGAAASSGARDPSFNAKGEYDKLCVTCHGSGLMNAPKLGDAAAWKERLDKHGSLDALVKQGIQGLNAMPPKGGSTINDDQFHDVVVYMLDESKVAY